jgi:hypothetical protein
MKLKNIFGAMLALLLVGCATPEPATAQLAVYSAAGTAFNDANLDPASFVVIPPSSAGTAIVTHVGASSDKAGSVLQFWRVTAQTVAPVNSTNFVIHVARTNGFSTTATVLIHYRGTDTYGVRVLEAMGASTLTVNDNFDNPAVKAGDSIYRVEATGPFIPVGQDATITVSGPAITAGERNKPLFLSVSGGTNATVNAATAIYR